MKIETEQEPQSKPVSVNEALKWLMVANHNARRQESTQPEWQKQQEAACL